MINAWQQQPRKLPTFPRRKSQENDQSVIQLHFMSAPENRVTIRSEIALM